MSIMKNKTIFTLILIFSISALIIAFFIEHVLGHKPCNLCIIERIPYILSIIIGATTSLSLMINLIDSFFALMAIPTMLATLLLSPKVIIALKKYNKFKI